MSVYRGTSSEAAVQRYREALISYGVTIAAGIVCAFLVLRVGPYAVIGAGALLFIAFAFRRIDLAVTFVVLISGVVFISLYSFRFWQLHISEVMLPLLVIVIWSKRLVVPGHRIVWDKIFWVLLGLIGVALLSWVHSYLFWSEAVPVFHRKILTQLARIGLVSLAVVLPMVIANTTFDWKQLKRLYRALAWAALIAGIVTIIHFLIWPDRGNWPYSEKIPMPTVGAILMPIVFAQAILGETKRERRLAKYTVFFICIAMVLHLKQTLYISTTVGVLLMAYLGRRRLFWGALGTMAAVILIFGGKLLQVLEGVAERTGSLQRPMIWSHALTIFRDNWFLGVGPANFYSHYLARWPETWEGFAANAHNEYLQLGTEFGIFALILTGIVVVWTIRSAWRLYKTTENGFCRMFALGVLGCFSAMLINVFFNNWLLSGGLGDFPHTMYYWVIIGMLWVVKQLDERDRATASAAEATEAA